VNKLWSKGKKKVERIIIIAPEKKTKQRKKERNRIVETSDKNKQRDTDTKDERQKETSTEGMRKVDEEKRKTDTK
jgi:hypothetical protein